MSERPLALTHARIITPQDDIQEGTVVIAGGRIVYVDAGPPPLPRGARIPSLDLRGLIVAPGYIDLHVHGGGGFSLDCEEAADIHGFCGWAPSTGVTSFLLAPMAADKETLLRRLKPALQVMDDPAAGATPLGFYLEGPFLNAGRAGAIPNNWLRPPSVDEFREYLMVGDNRIRIFALAPELDGAGPVIKAAVEAGVVVALAHSDATYEETRQAFSLGVRHVTHCFNAMRSFHHRDPGCIAAALSAPDVTVELIADGVHVHPGAMELLLRAKGADGVTLVTDAIPFAGMGDGVFRLLGEEVRVEGGVARRADGTLAGSAATMDNMVASAATLLIGLPQAIRMATLNPARVLGLSNRKGRVAPGYDADIIVLASDLKVEMAFVGGREVYRREE